MLTIMHKGSFTLPHMLASSSHGRVQSTKCLKTHIGYKFASVNELYVALLKRLANEIVPLSI